MTDELHRDRPPFAMVPEALLYDDRVTAFDVRLYAALDRHAGAGVVAWPGYNRLRTLLAFIEPTTGKRREPSDEAIGAAVERLEAAGWVDVTRVNGKSNRYRLRDRRRPQVGDQPVEEPSTTRASAAGTKGTTTRASAARPPAPARYEVEEGSRELPPNPPRAGGDAEHQGQHRNCRRCGTTRRGAPPPEPSAPTPKVDVTVELPSWLAGVDETGATVPDDDHARREVLACLRAQRSAESESLTDPHAEAGAA